MPLSILLFCRYFSLFEERVIARGFFVPQGYGLLSVELTLASCGLKTTIGRGGCTKYMPRGACKSASC